MSKSENGWEPSHAGPDILNWITVPGTDVDLQLMKGPPTTVMRAFAADFHAYVEPLRDADSGGFTPTNSVKTSNHLNGTAMDLNWNGPPEAPVFRYGITGERAYPGDKLTKLRDLLLFYEDVIYCGGFWSIRDWMHFQMGYNTWDEPRTDDFIRRRIRPDGLSTYMRDATAPPPPLGRVDRYALAVLAEGRRRNVTPRGIQIAFSVCFVESNWKMYANSNVPQSLNIPHDAVGSDHDSLGLFQQRCPMWGPAEVLMDPTKSAGLFYDRLVKLDYNNTARLPGDYAADVQRPAAKYRYRYQERMGDAVALYNKLAGMTAPPPEGEDELSAEAERKIDEIHRELTKRFPSRSRLRWLDARGDGDVDTLAGMVLNDDGNDHVLFVKELAALGHPESLALLEHIAAGDPAKYPHRAPDIELAQAILADLDSRPVQVVPRIVSATPADPQVVEKIVYRDPPEPKVVFLPAPQPEVSASPPAPSSVGEVIGRAYDALQELRLADALSIEERAPLAALIAVLTTKNGSQL